MANKTVKVAVTGAAGQIGYALVFRVANGDMFGKETHVDLRLLELEAALPALHGVAMELQDCAFPLLKKVTCTSDQAKAFDGVDYVVSVGSVPRKAGMERSDLLGINGGIFSKQGKSINDHAADDVRVFIVGNPCNTNCLIAMNHAPDVPNERFFAMTMLDEKRARSQLAEKAGVDVTAIKHMNIWGNHSATQYPDFYQAKINGNPATEVIADINWLQNDFIATVQKRGAEVIKARGASSAASAANAIIASVYAMTHDTVGDDYFSLSCCSQGEYGVDEGLIFSFPCRRQNGEIKIVEGIKFNQFANEKFQITLNELREERNMVKKLNLI